MKKTLISVGFKTGKKYILLNNVCLLKLKLKTIILLITILHCENKEYSF